MADMTDVRAVVESRVPAKQLRIGDLVNTSPGNDDWQEVLGVYHSDAGQPSDADLSALVDAVGNRYVVVQMTDLAPIDAEVYFSGGTAMVYGSEDDSDLPVIEVASTADGVRTYLYTKYEVVTVRSAQG
jgi:hypothetical protein